MRPDTLLELTRAALNLAEEEAPRVSAAIRRAYRIARLRGDLEAVYWLAYEIHPTGAKLSLGPIQRDVLRHLSRDEAKALHDRTLDRYLEGRAMTMLDEDGAPHTEEKVSGASVAQIEVHVESLLKQADEVLYDQETLQYGSSVDLERKLRRSMRWVAAEHRKVLSRILTRVHEFLVATEGELLGGKGHASIVQRNHEFVERELSQAIPEALAQLQNASAFAMGHDVESWSMTGTSCRRALKSVADVLYPANTDPIVGADGRARALDDSKWINRLWQFVSDRVSNEGAQATLRADLEFLGGTVDSLNVVSSKGVHAQLSASEAELCVTRTYLLIGDLLRLSEDGSGLEAVDTDEPDAEIVERTVEPTQGPP